MVAYSGVRTKNHMKPIPMTIPGNENERKLIDSRKPEAFYKMIDSLCVGRKLDYFSRELRPGWEVFGNDTERFNGEQKNGLE